MVRYRNVLKHYQQLRTVGLVGFLLFLPVSIAFAQICLSLLALSYLIEISLRPHFRWPQTPINRPLCCYIGLLLITTLFARNLWISVRNLEGIFTISTFYLIYLSIKDLEHLKKLLTLIFISVTFAACYGIIQHYLEVDLFRLTKPINLLKHVNDDLTAPVRISGFSSYMTFSGQLAMVIPLLCVSWCIARSYLKKGFITVSLFLAGLALLWTYTRSGWLAMVCSLLPFGYIKNKRITIFLITIFTLALLALLMLEQYDIIVFQTKLGERVFSIFRAKENLERIYTWQNSLDIITDYPLTGIGKGNFSKIVDSYRVSYGNFKFTSRAHAHNNLLQVAVEGGIFTLACFLWLWFVMFQTVYHAYQHAHRDNKTIKMLALGCLGALIAFFVQGGFEHNFGDSEAVMLMWTVMGFGMKLHEMAFLSLKH